MEVKYTQIYRGSNSNSDDIKIVKRVDMDTWRSIDYERKMRRELATLEKSQISDKNKRLILMYKNWRLASDVSVAGVQRELVSLRVLCERFDVELD